MSSSLASSLSSAHLGRGRSSVKSIKFNSSSSSSASVSRSSSNILSSKGRYSSNRNNSQSRVEQAILSAADPIEINEVEKVNVNGVSGILANKAEIESWKGNLPIDQYKLNQDPNPQVIKKKPSQKLHYKQEVAVRYLKPPAPEKPGDLIIVQEPDKQLPPPPPLVVRQQPPLPRTPEPLIIREAPPRTPPTIPQQVIHIPGKVIPASERKLVVEKLPEIPSKPQPIIIERWLPYGDVKRKVIYIHQEKKIMETNAENKAPALAVVNLN